MIEQTLSNLHEMKLHGMAQALREQLEQSEISELPFEERFSLAGGGKNMDYQQYA